MQIAFVGGGAEQTVTVGPLQVPVFVERDAAGKIVLVGVVVKYTHTSPGGKDYEWTSGTWVEAGEFRNQDGSLKTKTQIATLLRDKMVGLRDSKQTEWDALDTAIPEVLA